MNNKFSRLLLASALSISVFTNIEAVFHQNEFGEIADEKNSSNLINNAKFSVHNHSNKLDQLFFAMASGSTGVKPTEQPNKLTQKNLHNEKDRKEFAKWDNDTATKNLGFRKATEDGSDNNTLALMAKYAVAYGAKLADKGTINSMGRLNKYLNFADVSWNLHNETGLNDSIDKHRAYLTMFVALGANITLEDITVNKQTVTEIQVESLLRKLFDIQDNKVNILDTIKTIGKGLFTNIKNLEESQVYEAKSGNTTELEPTQIVPDDVKNNLPKQKKQIVSKSKKNKTKPESKTTTFNQFSKEDEFYNDFDSGYEYPDLPKPNNETLNTEIDDLLNNFLNEYNKKSTRENKKRLINILNLSQSTSTLDFTSFVLFDNYVLDLARIFAESLRAIKKYNCKFYIIFNSTPGNGAKKQTEIKERIFYFTKIGSNVKTFEINYS